MIVDDAQDAIAKLGNSGERMAQVRIIAIQFGRLRVEECSLDPFESNLTVLDLGPRMFSQDKA